MYVRVSWARLLAGAWEPFERHVNEKVKPSTAGLKGLRERRLLRGAADSQEVIVWTVWDTLQDLRTYELSDTRRELALEADQYYQPWAYAKGEYWVKHFEVVSIEGRQA